MEKEKIFGAINAVMEDVGAVGKNRTNEQQRYQFRGIEDVMNALSPAFIRNKVFCAPCVKKKEREERKTSKGGNVIYTIVEVEYTFFSSEDGSSIKVTIFGEGMDTGDKSMNKALSAAFKYVCFQLFCIPTEELHDTEEDHYEVKDRMITKEEQEKLVSASKRANMDLDGYLKKYGLVLDKLGYSTYCKTMIKLANADSVVPKSEGEQSIPEEDNGLPFK